LNEPRFRRVIIFNITSELKIFIQDSENEKKSVQLQNEPREVITDLTRITTLSSGIFMKRKILFIIIYLF